VNSAYWTFMMTSQFICTPEQAADGVPFRFDSRERLRHAR